MHIHKSLHWIFGIIAALVLFGAGFYVGTLDAANHAVTVTSQCVGIGSEKSFSSSYESVNGHVVRDEKTHSEKYTARCMCFASDRTHKNIWVDTVEFSGDSVDSVRNLCNSDCQKLCEGRLENFQFAE